MMSAFLCIILTIFISCNDFQAIMAEGKEHALAIGFTKMSVKDMYVTSL